jgi:ABC-2 type transport system permease protein
MLYAVSGLGLGLLISSVSRNQRQATQLLLLIVFLGLILSGFIFPRYAMPPVLSAMGLIFPLTFFIPIARGIYTKGIGIEFLWGPVFAIVVFVIVIIYFAVRLFRQRMD